jgi:hypothetical protein
MATNIQKQGYEVDGEIVTTLVALADLMGVEKVTKKDITGDGQFADVVNMVDLSDDEWESRAPKTASAEESDLVEVDKEAIYSTLTETVDLTPEEVQSSMPDFQDVDELKEFIKDLDTPTLEYLDKGLLLEWKATYHANIHRMRIAVEMKKHFFPELFQPKDSKKKKAKYGDLTTEQLFSKATDLKLEYKISGNDAIDRMRVIMALKEAGHLAE